MEELLMNRFVEIFGEKGTACYFAPGRINLIGEHTDYNGGHVFPAAIRDIWRGKKKRRPKNSNVF